MSSNAAYPVTRVIVVRHGEPDHSVRGCCYGWLDVPLSDTGREQADLAAEWLAGSPLAAVYSSDLRRARETAAPIAARHGLEPICLEAMRELGVGALEGKTYDLAREQYPDLFARWMQDPTQVVFPEGESFELLRERIHPPFLQMLARHAGETFALVAHAGVNRTLLTQALQMPPAALFRLGQAHGAISIVEWVSGHPTVALLNYVPTRSVRKASGPSGSE